MDLDGTLADLEKEYSSRGILVALCVVAVSLVIPFPATLMLPCKMHFFLKVFALMLNDVEWFSDV